MTTSRPHALSPPALSPREFQQFQELIHRHAGIHLSEGKQALLVGRLWKRLRDLDLHSFSEYYKLVRSSAEEMVRMLDRVSTNETKFFREPRQFRVLEERIFPLWRQAADLGQRPRRVRAWSAGCASGEEAYSIAMALLDAFAPALGWQLEVLATDISTRALELARLALYPVERARDIPEGYLKRYMLRGTGSQEGKMKPCPEVRALVRFERLNLNESDFRTVGTPDLILCRNVLIYFSPDTRRRTIERLLDRLAPDGLLLVGHAENLTGITRKAVPIAPTIYALEGSAACAGASKR